MTNRKKPDHEVFTALLLRAVFELPQDACIEDARALTMEVAEQAGMDEPRRRKAMMTTLLKVEKILGQRIRFHALTNKGARTEDTLH